MDPPFAHLSAVVTTIQEPTPSIQALGARLARQNAQIIVVGDTKGPSSYSLNNVAGFQSSQLMFLSLEAQMQSEFRLARLLPTRHYSRKNIGYLAAIASGTSCIYETDDDNTPLPAWSQRLEHVDDADVVLQTGDISPKWVNIYRHFSDDNIWPRGLPLDHIHSTGTIVETRCVNRPSGSDRHIWAPIQQGLADGAPDVDAIWRLVLGREFHFNRRRSALLPPGNWCPFNTQTTWWWPTVYPLLYIPSCCSFRMCDIWKSFVAQRCLWELGAGVVFHSPEVYQERNQHDLMRDFDDEVSGYLRNHDVAAILEATCLKSGRDELSGNLLRCYEALVVGNILPAEEILLVEAWVSDLAACSSSADVRY